MWRHVRGIQHKQNRIEWKFVVGPGTDEGLPASGGLKIGIHLAERPSTRFAAFSTAKDLLQKNEISWLSFGQSKWTIDLDALLEKHPNVGPLEWAHGVVVMEPEYEEEPHGVVTYNKPWRATLAFYLTPETIEHFRDSKTREPESASHENDQKRKHATMTPVEIQESLARFESDYPDPSKVAFIIMQFGATPAHDEIVKAIRDTLEKHGINALRADDKDYHDDLFPNVLTYIHGCGFAIAIFERIEQDDFNPNVSLEVGYLLALQKPTCLLKDKTLKTLPTDLVGKLYKEFDPQRISSTIPARIERWLSDRQFI